MTHCVVCSLEGGIKSPRWVALGVRMKVRFMIHPADDRFREKRVHKACLSDLKELIDRSRAAGRGPICVVCYEVGGILAPKLIHRALLRGFRFRQIPDSLRFEHIAANPHVHNTKECRGQLSDFLEFTTPINGRYSCFWCGMRGGVHRLAMFLVACSLRVPVKYVPGRTPTLHAHCEPYVKSEIEEMQKEKDRLGLDW